MDQFTLNLIFIGASFALYFGIAIWARAGARERPIRPRRQSRNLEFIVADAWKAAPYALPRRHGRH